MKKTFVTPQLDVYMIEQKDILTLSNINEGGVIATIDFDQIAFQ